MTPWWAGILRRYAAVRAMKTSSVSWSPAPSLNVVSVQRGEEAWTVTVDSRQATSCPGCGTQSKSRHSTYSRTAWPELPRKAAPQAAPAPTTAQAPAAGTDRNLRFLPLAPLHAFRRTAAVAERRSITGSSPRSGLCGCAGKLVARRLKADEVAQKGVVQMARTGALLVAAVYCFGALIVPWITAASSVRLALVHRQRHSDP